MTYVLFAIWSLACFGAGAAAIIGLGMMIDKRRPRPPRSPLVRLVVRPARPQHRSGGRAPPSAEGGSVMMSQMQLDLDQAAAARVEAMRARFDDMMVVVGTIYDQRHAATHLRQPPAPSAAERRERDVLRALTQLDALAEQAAREWERGDQAAAEDTLNQLFAAIQGDLLPHLQALAAEGESPAADFGAWADDLAALAESEAA